MPLRAILNEETLVSFKIPAGEWDDLKRSDKRKDLSLPCCSGRAVVKTSKLGTQFFAHYRKSPDCISEPESKEHLRLKSIVASAAEAAGWEVTTEFIGESKDGEKWIADVYCTKGKAKIALEIQLSQQTADELEYRQLRYKKSGVRAAWFMAPKVYQNSGHRSKKDFPRFPLEDYLKDDQTPVVKDYELTLERFVKHLLDGDFEWCEYTAQELLFYMEDCCWKCTKDLKIPIGTGDSDHDWYNDYIKTLPNSSTFYENLLSDLGNDKLTNLGLTPIAPVQIRGNTPGFPYCCICSHCGAPQTNGYTFKKLMDWGDTDRLFIVLDEYNHSGSYLLKGSDDHYLWETRDERSELYDLEADDGDEDYIISVTGERVPLIPEQLKHKYRS